MTFLVFEDNGGSYHWTIVAADGATLARSEGFASYNDAEQAAQRVREAATASRFERHRNSASPVDLIARREAARRDAASDRQLSASHRHDQGPNGGRKGTRRQHLLGASVSCSHGKATARDVQPEVAIVFSSFSRRSRAGPMGCRASPMREARMVEEMRLMLRGGPCPLEWWEMRASM